MSTADLNKQHCKICLSMCSEPSIKLQCEHEFCELCIKIAFKYTIVSKSTPRCPSWSQIQTDDEIKRICDQKDCEKYDMFKLISKVDSDPNLHWCPNPLWDKKIVHVEPNGNKPVKAECECGFTFCIIWHEKWGIFHSCKKEVKHKWGKYLRSRKAKCWPKCRSLIEHNGGCNHMRCIIWDYEFWWNWGQKYSDSHFDNPFNGCAVEMREDWVWRFIMSIVILPFLLLIYPLSFISEYLSNRDRDSCIMKLQSNCWFRIFVYPLMWWILSIVGVTIGLIMLTMWPILVIPISIRIWCRDPTNVVDNYAV